MEETCAFCDEEAEEVIGYHVPVCGECFDEIMMTLE